MAYVTIPKDLSQIKTKVAFGLTKRQLICFGLGVLGASAATLGMIFLMMPFFLLAMYEHHGQPLEVVLRYVVESRFQRPKRRLYETNNLYLLAMKQVQLNREVNAIVSPQTQADPRRTKANCRCHRTGQKHQ